MKEAFEKLKDKLSARQESYESEAFEELNRYGHSLDYESAKGKETGILEALSIVSEVEAEYGNGWIPCSERLPEKSGRVLVSYESINDEIAVSETSYDYKRKTFWISPCVIAWMPLPEAYKPEI